MIVKEERYALKNVHDLSSKSFEHYYASSSYSDAIKDAYRANFSIANLRKHFDRGEHSTRFCVVDNGVYIGTIDLHKGERVRRMYIDPDREGEGIATMLINAVIQHMQDNNINTVLGAYAGDNGISFWENQGFITTLNIKGIYTYMIKNI